MGSKVSDCLVLEGDEVVIRDVDLLSDVTPATNRFIGAQTCLVSTLTPLSQGPARRASRHVQSDPIHKAPGCPEPRADDVVRRALQAKAPRLRVQPETVRHSEVQFLHLYVVVEWKNGKKFMTLVRQDEPDERILSPEMKTAWNKVDRTKLKHAIFAPTSRRLGKTAEQSMEEERIEAYNQKRIPREWLKLGAKFGEVISPSLSELQELVFQVARERWLLNTFPPLHPA